METGRLENFTKTEQPGRISMIDKSLRIFNSYRFAGGKTMWFVDLALILILIGCSSDPKQQAMRLTRRAFQDQLDGRYEKALTRLRRAIQFDPACAVAYVSMGQIYCYQRKESESRAAYLNALEAYESLLGSDSANVKLKVDLAGVHIVLQQYPNAMRILREVLIEHPDHPTAVYFMQSMRQFSNAWNQSPAPHPSEQKIQRTFLASIE